jgi:hypothetical protein
MSFDLTLFPRAGRPPLERQDFLAYFNNEKLHQHDGDTVNYSNEDTGVYFHLTWQGGGSNTDEAKDDTGATAPSEPTLYFNMNYFRPHTFGLEAVRVLAGLVQRFDLVVDDPQADGMGQGDFTPEGFLRSWNSGNRFAVSAIRQMRAQGETPLTGNLTLPTALNAACWRWNYFRETVVEDLRDLDDIDVYVPPIWFCDEGGQARTFALYPNLVPTAVPQVDYVLLLRNELEGPFADQSNDTPAWVRWEDFVAAFSRYRVRCLEPEPGEEPDAESHPHVILYDAGEYPNNENVPEGLANWVINQPDWPGRPDRVAPDDILDAELLASVS